MSLRTKTERDRNAHIDSTHNRSPMVMLVADRSADNPFQIHAQGKEAVELMIIQKSKDSVDNTGFLTMMIVTIMFIIPPPAILMAQIFKETDSKKRSYMVSSIVEVVISHTKLGFCN